MLPLSSRVRKTAGSQTLAQTAKAKRLREAGMDVVALTAGEPDFPTPGHVKEAALAAIASDFTHYTENEGIRELREVIAAKFSRENDFRVTAEQILVSTGAKQSIFNALQAICNPGDEVLLLSPYWVSYPDIIKLADATPVIVSSHRDGHFRPDIRRIRDALSRHTKALILNTPCNPSGVVYSSEEISQIADLVRDAGIYVLSDEIYEKITYDGNRHISIGSFPGMEDKAIVVNGLSKAFAMTGWRIGYMGGPPEVIKAASKVQSQVTSNPNSIAQKAAVAALTGGEADVRHMVGEFSRRRDLAMEFMSRIPDLTVVKPEGAFYFLLGVSRFYGRRSGSGPISSSGEMADYLLDRHGVAVVPGAAFGMDACIRLSYACSVENLRKGLERMREGLTQLSSDHVSIP
jgi:aspartate aminotransferase